jgi:putrescine transport system permease protein
MKRSLFLTSVLCFGVAFLYVPIASMMVYSFNSSRLAAVWGGFSTEWYGKLWENDQVWDALLLSLRIAAVSATLATVLGVMSALALVRFGAFRGRGLFAALNIAPLVLPEIIIAIAVLMLFVIMGHYIGWPAQRGATTITLAHATLSVTYVVTVVRARLIAMDRSLEEAALDMGARPLQVLATVTLPIIAPAILAGWLLAFTLSLDNVVVSNFTSGPGATTLPILIWSKVKLGVSPDINALATVMVLAVSVVVALTAFVAMRKGKARQLGIATNGDRVSWSRRAIKEAS